MTAQRCTCLALCDLTVPGQPVLRADFAWLAAILGLAIVLRVIGLNAPLWFDEIATIDSHIRLPWGEMMRDYSMNHHYFFSMQAKASSQLFGSGIWAYRLPAMAFGVGTVAAIWWLARDIAGSRVAHVSALLIAISYHQVWFSQNARGYTELAFWNTLGMIFFLRGLKNPTRATWIGFGLSLAAAVFTHLTGAFFFVALGLIWLATLLKASWQKQLSRAQVTMPLLGSLLGTVLLFILYLPILPSITDTVGTVAETSAIDPMQEYQNPLWTVMEGIRTAIGNVGPLAALVATGGLFAMILGAVGAYRTAPVFAPAVLAHVALTVGALLFMDMRIWPRFFFADIGFFMILIVIGSGVAARIVAKAMNRPRLEGSLFAIAAATMVLVSAVLVLRNYTAPKQDLAAAYVMVEETRQQTDRVYSLGPSGPLYKSYFQADWGNIRTPEEYERAMSEPGSLTLVVPFPSRMFRTIPEMEQDIGTSLNLVHRFPGTLGDGDVFVFRRD